MIQIAICDDEENSRFYLKSIIQDQNVNCEVTEFESGEAVLKSEKEYDILILDIDLKEEMSGMELAECIRNSKQKRQPIIIFVTGYKEYVFDAFDVGAFHYLMKPVSKEKWMSVFEKALQQLEVMKEKTFRTIHIQSGTASKVIAMDEVFYVESQNHKVFFHTKQGIYDYYAKISDLEEQLKESFFRIHKGFLINLAYIDYYTKSEVVLLSGEQLPLSKYKYADFVKTYLRFME